MREKRTFRAKIPTTQEAFADCVKEGKAVIVINHSLVVSMNRELNDSKSNKGAKKVLKLLGKFGVIAGIFDPIMWLYSVVCFLFGGILKDKIKEYDIYSGLDINDENIIILIKKKDYDPKLDIIKYDDAYVKSVSPKPLKGKIPPWT